MSKTLLLFSFLTVSPWIVSACLLVIKILLIDCFHIFLIALLSNFTLICLFDLHLKQVQLLLSLPYPILFNSLHILFEYTLNKLVFCFLFISFSNVLKSTSEISKLNISCSLLLPLNNLPSL